MTTRYSLDGLETRIKEHSEFLDSITSLIPPKHYFKNEPSGEFDIEGSAQKYQPNKRKRLEKQVLNEQRKRAKKLKLDPNNLKTVLEIQQEKLEKMKLKENEDAEIDEDEDEVQSDDDSENEKDVNLKDESPSVPSDSKLTIAPSRNIVDRLAQLRRASSIPTESINDEKQLSKRKAHTASNKSEPGSEKADHDKNSNHENGNQGEKKIFFSKFEFDEQKKKKKGKKDEKKLVEELETHKKEIEKLKQEDPKKAEKLIETKSWQKVLQKARGEKIKDDPKLLKKSIKRTQTIKKKSEKAWKERIKIVEKSKFDRQKKRAENIQARLDASKKKKKSRK
ncbi:542_t:CDS:10 [Ambispora gerdemannii]|uniref:542_t:CDS:1 n=1 Tax=Ambispora gerdemannii TaxID=144530 RepID=A0A9N9BJU8_9GLOM|nr:542_t:CDS:10 [Ambispora gerdemannii]